MATPYSLLPRDPFFRWLLIGLGIGLLVLLPVAILLLSSQRQATQVNVNVDAERTATAVAIAIRMATITAGPLPTATPEPTRPATATPPPTPPPPTQPPPTQAPPPTAPPPPAPAPAAQAAPTAAPSAAPSTPTPAPPTAQAQQKVPAPPTATQAAPAAPTAGQTQAAAPAAGATPTPFAGQVSPAGGLGNTRADLDAALGRPVGETQAKLTVYRKDNVEYRVQFTDQPQQPPEQRALIIVRMTPQNERLNLEGAIREARKLFPRDAQPRSIKPEGEEVVVERFVNQTLARALPEHAFRERKGQPGEFLAVYLRSRDDQVSHVIVGVGDDPDPLRDAALKP